MKKDFAIFSVDDTESSRNLLEMALGWTYRIEAFESGEACLQRLSVSWPDMFLLDVNMLGMNGYELCKRIRSLPGGKKTPIVFISGREDVKSRLEAYEAGGDDFIIKPFELKELELKIAAICRLIGDKSELQEMFVESEILATQVLSNLEELTELTKFLHALNASTNYRELAEAMMKMIRSLQLEGALQLRLPGFEITLNHAGDVCPLEASIINQVHASDTVVRFKSRAAYNCNHVSLLISNMPTNDLNFCERLRDYVTVALEMTNTKLDNMLFSEAKAKVNAEVDHLLDAVISAEQSLNSRSQASRQQAVKSLEALLAKVATGLVPAAMTPADEDIILDGVKFGATELIERLDQREVVGVALGHLADRIKAFRGKLG